MAELKMFKVGRISIDEDVREAVEYVLKEGYPLALIARRPDGDWEITWQIGQVSKYEMIGVLQALQHRLFSQDD